MLRPTEFRNLVSGRRQGWLASIARGLLRIVEVPYTWVVRLRNRRFDLGRAQVHRVDVPVISVGNLTLGGTGKTPLVEWIARTLADRDIRVALVSRGYGSTDQHPNDEARQLAQRLPDVPHVQDPDRVAAARRAIAEHDCQVILLDDGFQHRRLARDLDLVVVDALEPFGFGHVFPRGTLREPLEGLARAGAIVLSRADMLDPAERETIRRRLLRFAPHAIWCEAQHAPQQLLAHGGATAPLESLRNQRVAAFCGIGNPAAFRATLERCGYDVLALREYDDHAEYRREEVDAITRWATDLGAQAVVCTHKDLVKVATDHLGPLPLWAVTIEIELLGGEDELQALLDGVVTKCRRG